jgi:hypothetical protein
MSVGQLKSFDPVINLSIDNLLINFWQPVNNLIVRYWIFES